MISTPFFVFYPNRVWENYELIRKTLPVDRVFYATKPNHETCVLETLNGSAAGFEVISSGQMNELIDMGVGAEDVICSLPIKKQVEILRMYELGCRYFVFDSRAEYEKLAKIAPDSRKIARLYVADYSEHDIGFGLRESELAAMHALGIVPDGYTFYVLNLQDRLRIYEKIFRTLNMIVRQHPRQQELILNIGGNYPLPDRENEQFYAFLRRQIASIRAVHPGIRVYAEPGRCIVNTAFDLVTEVCHIRGSDIYIDAHSQILKLPPSAVEPLDGNGDDSASFTEPVRYHFYECLCSRYLLFSASLPFRLEEGMKIILRGCGAYSLCFANQFHGTGKPEILLKNEEEYR